MKEYVNYTLKGDDTLHGVIVYGVSARDVYLKSIQVVKKLGGHVVSTGQLGGVDYVEGDE
jgi:hypothetical protein